MRGFASGTHHVPFSYLQDLHPSIIPKLSPLPGFPMIVNKRYIPPPLTEATCQTCQDLTLRHPAIDGMLGIPLALLDRSSQSGCPCCKLLVMALRLPGLEPPEGESLFGVTLFADDAPNGSSEEMPGPLIMRCQTEYRNFAEADIFTEEGQHEFNA